MEKIKLGDLIASGTFSVAQDVAIYIDSYSRAVAFEGTTANIPDGYKNFIVNGIAAENNVLKIRVKLF